jgi:hypothetical protein
MTSISRTNVLGRTFIILLLASSLGLLMLTSVVFSSSANGSVGPSTLPGTMLVSTPPTASKGPDDITMLATPGLDGGKPLIWTEWQNGINPDGTRSCPTCPTASNVTAFDAMTGALIESIPVKGHVDGVTANPWTGAIIVTSNEDANSNFNLINPATKTVTSYTYSPSPEVSGSGGTDSIAVINGRIYVSHSNPNDNTQATAYLVNLDNITHTANLTPVFYDDSTATDVVTSKTVTLDLTDPDSNYIMPSASPRFAGELATISQADGQIIFANLGTTPPPLYRLSVTDNVPGNVPPIDGLVVATSGQGTLYVVDAKANTISALDTTGWPTGTVFVTEPDDNGNPILGTLDLSTGKITPLGNAFQSPKGLLFVPGSNSYSFSASPGSYDASSGNWVISPDMGGVTFTGATNDLAVTQITISGACTGACSGDTPFVMNCNNVPPITTCSVTPSERYNAGDTWNVVVTFYHGASVLKTVKASLYPTVVVAPEFPYGAALAILAPIAALGLFIALKRGRLSL